MTSPKREVSAGGVVFRRFPDGPRYLLIFDSHGNWGFPKGHVEEGEDPVASARREIKEETGLDNLIMHGDLGSISWSFRSGRTRVHKRCYLYLFESPQGEAVPEREEGIRECRWLPGEAASATLTFDNARAVLDRAREKVQVLTASAG
ncbi:Putative mutator protein MutT4 [bacterium HR33]|nr:Putative mutator protein MutT4 [bacterium HR33]